MAPLVLLLASVIPVPAPPVPTGPTPTFRLSAGVTATGVQVTDILPPVVRYREVPVVVGQEIHIKAVPYTEPLLRLVTRDLAFAEYDLSTAGGKALTPAEVGRLLPRGAVFLFSEYGPIEAAFANALAADVVVVSRKKAGK